MFSEDGGLSWSGQQHHPDLIEPICQASLLSHNNILFFSNPASQEKRENLTIKISYDHGITWPDAILLYTGPSAYSDLVVLSDKNIGCLYERGKGSPYEQIIFQSVAIFGQSDRREK
jgi:sialidase-1